MAESGRSILPLLGCFNNRFGEERTFWPNMQVAPCSGCCHAILMLTEPYIEALLADEALPDQVWAPWDAGVITDEMAAWA